MSYERLDICPVCNKTEFTNYLVVQDKAVSQESFVIVECENCSFKFTNPRPDEQSIGKYYESDDYISHNSTAKGIMNKVYKMVRSITIGQKVDLINKYSPKKGTLLDYGCGTGHFLAAAAKDGWTVSGYEPNANARTQAAINTGVEIKYGDLKQSFENEQFSIVTMWHVLEHIHKLNETFKQLIDLTKPGGVMVIAVPNVDSFDAREYKENWAAYDVPRHLYHFNQITMKRFLKKHKLVLEEVIPMKFDAYYVSLLSEKYKKGRNNMVSFMMQGFKSNWYARQNEKDYSSLIYIARKK